MVTDIVVMTCERLALLKRTLAHIWERTRTTYRLHVIDDASTEGNAEYLSELLAQGRIASALLRPERVGIAAHLRAIGAMSESDPVVFTDDDVLCPRLEPDWLARGLAAMAAHPEVGLLALNNPECNIGGKRGPRERGHGGITYCRNVGGTFAFARRAVLDGCAPGGRARSPVKIMCVRAAAAGWRVAYLADVYCQHIGMASARNGRDLSAELALVMPLDPLTLEPVDEYKG